MPKHVKRLLRHTDGSPDNVAKMTHIFHWLLVLPWLLWEEVTWFMFESLGPLAGTQDGDSRSAVCTDEDAVRD